MKITFNSPLILIFAIVCMSVQVLSDIFGKGVTYFFMVGNQMNISSPLDYFRLVTHSIGHNGWGHLFGNFMFILAIGPILEEKYGSLRLLLMFFITALVTGVLNVLFSSSYLHGASGIVFMLIILGSITNIKKREIPLTFILIFVLYIGKEIVHVFDADYKGISQFAHIIGGICGSVFGFMEVNGVSSAIKKR